MLGGNHKGSLVELPGMLPFEKEKDILVVHAEALLPPGSGVAIPVVDAALEQPPTGPVAPVEHQTEGSEGLGKVPGTVADHDGADPARSGDAEKPIRQCSRVEGP